MAKPPRFQRKRRGQSGFVKSVRDAMEQIQTELNAATADSRGAVHEARQDVESVRDAMKKPRERSLSDAVKTVKADADRLRHMQLQGPSARPRPEPSVEAAAKPAGPYSLEGRGRAAESREGSTLEGAGPESSSLEGAGPESSSLESAGPESSSLEGVTPLHEHIYDTADAPATPATAPTSVGAGLRQFLQDRESVQRAFVLREILGRPKGLR